MSKKIIPFFILFFSLLSVKGQELKIGEQAPNFKLYNLKGESSTLSNYQNKIVVIKMWFTTCAPCIHEIPKVNKVVEKYKNRDDIAFLAPAPNSKTTLNKFLENIDLKYEVMSSSYDMLKVYNTARLYPKHLIINKKGIVSFVYKGSSKDIDTVLIEEIEKLL